MTDRHMSMLLYQLTSYLLISLSLLTTHNSGLDIESVINPEKNAYSWQDAQDLNQADSLHNYQSFVFYALFAKLADLGWRLDIDDDDARYEGRLTRISNVL